MTLHPLARWTGSGVAGSTMPDTIMAAAFLRAIVVWAQRNTGKPMTLPTGVVDAGELRAVVVALVKARRQ